MLHAARFWMGRALAATALFFLLTFAATAAPQAPSPLEAAGKLRSLAQRQVKLNLQIALGVERSAAEARLRESVAEFDRLVPLVQAAAREGAAARSARRLGAEWASQRALLLAPPAQGRAATLGAGAEQLSIAAQGLAVQFDLAQDAPLARLADLASRTDMLAQRLARLYLATQSGAGGEAAKVDLAQTSREFMSAFASLEEAGENTAAIRAKLRLVRQQWMFFEFAVNDPSRATNSGFEFVRRDVASTSERISQVMAETAAAYSQLALAGARR
ncbi:MAG: hypothetical protein REI09_01580 [Candidatus Dactylopiibacterium sp.]|nr:hypothetical protein [Candidatus Dactylopiibacterium sp.]